MVDASNPSTPTHAAMAEDEIDFEMDEEEGAVDDGAAVEDSAGAAEGGAAAEAEVSSFPRRQPAGLWLAQPLACSRVQPPCLVWAGPRV